MTAEAARLAPAGVTLDRNSMVMPIACSSLFTQPVNVPLHTPRQGTTPVRKPSSAPNFFAAARPRGYTSSTIP